MANCLFAYPNVGDGATLSGGSWLGALPLANVQNAQRAKIARSTDDEKVSTIINADFATSRVHRTISVLSHNLTVGALIRTRFGDDATFAAHNYDSGWVDVYEPIYPPDVLSWGDAGFWDGRIPQSEIDLGYPFDYHLYINTSLAGRYLRIEIDDESNGDTYVEIGRVVVSLGYQPTINMKTGLTLGWDTSSEHTETDSGVTFHNARRRRRTMSFTVPLIGEDEALVKLFEISRRQGTHDPFLFIYDPDDTVHLNRRAFLATLHTISPLTFPYATRTDAPFSVVEEL